MTEQELREILNNFLVGNIRTVEDAVLAIEKAGYMKLAEDQSLPENPHQRGLVADPATTKQNLLIAQSNTVIYAQAQQEMIEAGWWKVIIIPLKPDRQKELQKIEETE